MEDQAGALRLATFRLARRLRAQRADDGMSDAQFMVLASLRREGESTLGRLAERERVSAPSMNRTVNCLEEAGYVGRRTDDVDRRRVYVAATEKGAELVAETVRRRDAWLTDALGTLAPDEQQLLASATELLRRLAEE
jgi:DNA-binding MarR family transcriptional regulator